MWGFFFEHLYIYSFESRRVRLFANMQGSFIMQTNTEDTVFQKNVRPKRSAAVKAVEKIKAVREWEELSKNSAVLQAVANQIQNEFEHETSSGLVALEEIDDSKNSVSAEVVYVNCVVINICAIANVKVLA